MTVETQEYYSLITSAGLAAEAAAKQAGTALSFATVEVGHGGGSSYDPTPDQAALLGKWWEGPVEKVYRDAGNPAVLYIEATIPSNVGGDWVREAAVRLPDGTRYALIKHAPMEKTLPASGQSTELTLVLALTISNQVNVSVEVDPTNYARREDVTAALGEHTGSADPHPQYAKRSDEEIGFIAPAAIQDLSPGGTYVVDSSAASRSVRLPSPSGADRRPTTIIRRGANPVDVLRQVGTDTIEGAAEDLRLDKNYQVVVLAPSSATDWQILNRRK
ncbi:MAG: phage tail protein [Gammaproteobacteria bacterium]|nr:phage tail protein [Gammaproteobacteria bacterium]